MDINCIYISDDEENSIVTYNVPISNSFDLLSNKVAGRSSIVQPNKRKGMVHEDAGPSKKQQRLNWSSGGSSKIKSADAPKPQISIQSSGSTNTFSRHRSLPSSSKIKSADAPKQEPYNWSNGATNYLLHLIKEQRISQLAHPELKHPVLLNNDQLLVAFNAKYKPVTLKQLRRKLQLTNYRNVHYNKWKDEITKLVEKRKSNGTVIRPFIKQTVVLPNLNQKYDWTGEATTLLTELAREQRISQFCDTSIVSHPYGFNLNALLLEFNRKIENQITMQQLQTKLHKGNIYNDAKYEQWKGKIAELAEQRKAKGTLTKFTE